jgi:beta-galactosidase
MNTRLFAAGILAWAVLFPVAPAGNAQVANAPPGRSYELGTVYIYYADTPDEQIVQDLETMSRIGMKQVSLFPPYLLALGRPEPDFRKSDLAVRTAERLGLKVVPLLFFAEQLPGFAAAKWPDREPELRVTYEERQQSLSLANPEVFSLLEYYVGAAVRHFKDSPAVTGWNVWTEPHFDLSRGDPYANRWLDAWLLKKYGSALELNRHWQTPYFNDEYSKVDSVLARWDANADILQRLVALVKSIDPVRPTRSHAVGSTVVNTGLSAYSQNGQVLSKSVDQWGLSWYPDIMVRGSEANAAATAKTLATWEAPWAESLTLTDVHDSAPGKPFVVMEAQTGPQSGMTHQGFLDYESIHRMVWQSVAHDAKAMVFWKWYPFRDGVQAFGRGLVATDGSPTDRAVAAGDASRVLNADPDLFLDSHPVPPQVAVVYDVLGDLKAKVRGGDWGGMMAQDTLGIYKILWRDQVRVNVLNAPGLTAADLKPYRLVIFPFYMCLRPNVAEAIETYVREGGTVLADARFGIMDEWHEGYRVNPGLSMAKLFGARRHDFTAVYRPAEIRLTGAEGWLKGLNQGEPLAGGVFREQLQLEPGNEGSVIGVFENTDLPAIVAKRTGKGRTFLLASLLGVPMFDGENAGTTEFVRALLRTAGVEPPVTVKLRQGTGPVEAVVQTRNRPDERLLFLINWAGQPKPVTAELPWPGTAALKATDRVSGRAVPVEHAAGLATLELTLPAGRVAVVHIHP